MKTTAFAAALVAFASATNDIYNGHDYMTLTKEV